MNLFLNVLKFCSINSMNLIFYEPSVHTSDAYILDAAMQILEVIFIHHAYTTLIFTKCLIDSGYL